MIDSRCGLIGGGSTPSDWAFNHGQPRHRRNALSSSVAHFHLDGGSGKGKPLACADAVEAKLPGNAHDPLTLVGNGEAAKLPRRLLR